MKKPIKDYIKKLQKMVDELRYLRDSKANPCNEKFAEGACACPCHTFDQAIDHIENAESILKTL